VTQESQRDHGSTGDHDSTRRGILASVGLAGLAGTLAACGGSNGSNGASAASGGASAGAAAGAASSGASAAASGAAGAGASSGSGTSAGTALAATSEIPMGGGKVFAAEKVVVTQPVSGTFKAFSAVCTHMQCIVDRVANGTIDCPCHGSKFKIADGAVAAGPAPSPLPAESIKVEGGKIVLA
jgi:nitrite reductase/ring-hydroxylating ferredoxin subunit